MPEARPPVTRIVAFLAGSGASSDPALIKSDLLAAGFTEIALETLALSNRVSAHEAAPGMVLGSPFRAEIERRDASALDRATNAARNALQPWDGKQAPMSAHVVTAIK